MAGWDVTLADFRQLTGYPDYRPAIAPLFAKWFGYTIEGSGAHTLPRAGRAVPFSPNRSPSRPQASPDKKYELYQTA